MLVVNFKCRLRYTIEGKIDKMAAPMNVFQNSNKSAFKQEQSPFEQEQDANTALSELDRGHCTF